MQYTLIVTSTLAFAVATNAEAASVQSVTATGSGCREGSYHVKLGAGGASFRMVFDRLVVRSGDGVSQKRAKRACTLTVRIDCENSTATALDSVTGSNVVPAGGAARQFVKVMGAKPSPFPTHEAPKGQYVTAGHVEFCDDPQLPHLRVRLALDLDEVTGNAQMSITSYEFFIRK